MAELHKIELFLIELNDTYGSSVCIEEIEKALNGIAMTTIVKPFGIKSKKIDFHSDHPLNKIKATKEEFEKEFQNE